MLFKRLGVKFPEDEHSFWLDLVDHLPKYGMLWGRSIKLPAAPTE